MPEIPNNINLKISSSGITNVRFNPVIEHIIVSTEDGRVRIYDYTTKRPNEIFRKKWHKNISCLEIGSSGRNIITSSVLGSLKVHDYETEKCTWSNIIAHEASISAVTFQIDSLIISGDEEGLVKFWDIRQKEEITYIQTNNHSSSLTGINDICIDSNRRHIFLGLDDGTMCTVHGRKRTIEIESELLESSIKSVMCVKNQDKVLVASESGMISFFNWNMYGDRSDRFPILSKNDKCFVERAVKINEKLVAIGTNTGVIKAVSLFPNVVLNDIGNVQLRPKEKFSDFITMDVDCQKRFLASSCVYSNVVSFFPLDSALKEAIHEADNRLSNKRKKIEAKKENFKNNKKIRKSDGFFDDLLKIDDESDLYYTDD